MIDFEVKGAIFDVDDTLLDNKPGNPGNGLHERSRLAAAREAGARYGILALEELSVEDNLAAFMTASVHTLEAAVWNILRITGVADSDVIDPESPLLREIVARKDELHEGILLNEAEEVLGSTRFVFAMAEHGLRGKLAVASTAIRRDVDLYFKKTGLNVLFPSDQIITKELVTRPKPDPEVFNLAFASLGLPEGDKSSVCAFEDDPRGIASARAAGLYVCAITTRFKRSELLSLPLAPHLVADSYDEFSELFGLKI